MAQMKLGIIGCGNIAEDLCIALQKGGIAAEICALTDVDAGRAETLKQRYALSAPICDLDENARAADFLVECAAPGAVQGVIDAVIRHRKGCLIMSVAGLLQQPELLEQAREAQVEVRLPSGAICGLDGVRAAREGGIDKATLITRKPPQGLEGAPYLVEKGIVLAGITEPMVVFSGNALEACKAFPKNVNVSAALSLAGLGAKATEVQVVADPTTTVNSHEIVVEGAFGRLVTRTENRPSPRNPKSSYLASLSACAELRAAAEAFAAHNG